MKAPRTWITLEWIILGGHVAPNRLGHMTNAGTAHSTKEAGIQTSLNRASSADAIDPRLRGIARALARHAAREHYAQSCLEAEKDSDSES